MNAFEAPRAIEGIDETFDAFELAPLTPVIGAEVRNAARSGRTEQVEYFSR